jgi:hypothetical protein
VPPAPLSFQLGRSPISGIRCVIARVGVLKRGIPMVPGGRVSGNVAVEHSDQPRLEFLALTRPLGRSTLTPKGGRGGGAPLKARSPCACGRL